MTTGSAASGRRVSSDSVEIAGPSDSARQVGGEVVPVFALQLWTPPVPAIDRAAARRAAALALHGTVVVVEQRIVGGQFLARADLAHRHQHNVADEADVRLIRVVEKQNH